ncbi:hypothetical protein LGH82_08505 [Mesorhizobium sp. PAMC28654]|jgi:hypothetical protein|uniref:hypothetical protein n=1 Tax=Mesorhizobium sp. PAMC28654 TaxID=2880934 RepID=UPI001D09AAF5|nr:hypothetical protein [Mesorhizobium sp. PAMC28654]UDL91284.1 hypothetical protein LGH82_08505 [Mesorhizobium sp. PAMC28654]
MVIGLFPGTGAFEHPSGAPPASGSIPFGVAKATEAVAFAMDFSRARYDSQSRH